MSSPRFHTLSVAEVRKETKDCVSIAFHIPPELAQAFSYIPGQYITIKKEIAGEELRRSYSICSGKNEPFRVAVKKVEEGRFSSFANEQLKAGDNLEVMTPTGNFHVPLNPDNKKTYVGFAAGSGITPLLSLLKDILETEPSSHFILFYGNRGIDSIIFREELENLKNKYLGRLSVHHILSRENLGSTLMNGRIDKTKCESFCDTIFEPSSVDTFFLCGPEDMIVSAKNVLENRGVAPENIHYELFTTPSAAAARKTVAVARTFDPEQQSKVTIKLDADSFDFNLPFSGDSILDAALKAGADLPYACKGGVCCTCRAKLTEGEVDMEVNYALEPEEVEAGFILTCQAHPRTSVVVLDFDEK